MTENDVNLLENPGDIISGEESTVVITVKKKFNLYGYFSPCF